MPAAAPCASRPAARPSATRGGPIWFDAADGHIIEARWGIPNHSEYRDFALRLTGVSDGGAGGNGGACSPPISQRLSRLEYRLIASRRAAPRLSCR